MEQYSPGIILAGFFLVLGAMVAGTIYAGVRYARWFNGRVAENKQAGFFETAQFKKRITKLAMIQLLILAILGAAAVAVIIMQGTIISVAGLWLVGGFIFCEAVYSIPLTILMTRRKAE